MNEFSLNSKYFDNVLAVANCVTNYKNDVFTINVNNLYKIELPIVVAASISTSVIRSLQTDQTSKEININIIVSGDISNTIDKIRRIIILHETVEIDDNDKGIFAEFGRSIGNDDFMVPLNELINTETHLLDEENVVRILSMKQTFGNRDATREKAFIATNFERMRTNEAFVDYATNPDNIDTVEEIIRSDDLKIDKEDNLLAFCISVANSNKDESVFYRLFEYVYLEYCSINMCKEFLSFVKEIIPIQNIRSLISCIERRMIQDCIPMDPDYIEGRHKHEEAEHLVITNDDPLNGILRQENEKENVLMVASSTHNGDVYDLIKNDPNSDFFTDSVKNSYIEASLKDEKTFVIKSYMIRGSKLEKYNHQLQHWKLEGMKASNGEWILLDRHKNDPFDKLQVKVFNISCNEKLKKVKLTIEGRNTYNGGKWYYLEINSFDIFGTLYF